METLQIFIIFLSFFLIKSDEYHPNEDDDDVQYRYRRSSNDDVAELSKDLWYGKAKDYIDDYYQTHLWQNYQVGKNVILFLGDGMGMPSITAGRIYKAQKEALRDGREVNGEESELNMEKLRNSGFSKVYNVNRQTPDSAGTGTAYLCGAKTNYYYIGVDAGLERGDCQAINEHSLSSVIDWYMKSGKATGVVTTTRVTHATPAASYAHTFQRNHEVLTETDVYYGMSQKMKNNGCRDIAEQLITDNHNITIVLGGGYTNFIPPNKRAPGYKDSDGDGLRSDDRDLLEEYEAHPKHRVISSRKELMDWEKLKKSDNILGLFSATHLEYELTKEVHRGKKTHKNAARANKYEPTFSQMVETAIKYLEYRSKGEGYFLLAEGGRIDQAHHDTQAAKALAELAEFDNGIKVAKDKYSPHSDTTIIVTADHSHVFTFGVYSDRGSDVTGLVRQYGVTKKDDRGNQFTIQSYGNGPNRINGYRSNLTDEMVTDSEYKYESTVYSEFETHGGEDVAIYSQGPMSSMLVGTHEQHFIAHVIGYATCSGPYDTHICRRRIPLSKTSKVDDMGPTPLWMMENMSKRNPHCSIKCFAINIKHSSFLIILSIFVTILIK